MPHLDLELVANASYAILLASYIMRDILWLRLLTVVSLGFEIPYFFFQPDPLWAGIGWDVAFIAVNVYWIAILVYERRPVHFTPEQKRLWQTALHRLKPRHVRTLFKRGTVKSLAPNDMVVTSGGKMDEVILIADGKVKVRINDKTVEELGPGHFLGTPAFLDEDHDFPAFTTVVAVEPTRIVTWKHGELEKLLENDNELTMAIEATMGLDLVNLVRRAWKREAMTG